MYHPVICQWFADGDAGRARLMSTPSGGGGASRFDISPNDDEGVDVVKLLDVEHGAGGCGWRYRWTLVGDRLFLFWRVAQPPLQVFFRPPSELLVLHRRTRCFLMLLRQTPHQTYRILAFGLQVFRRQIEFESLQRYPSPTAYLVFVGGAGHLG